MNEHYPRLLEERYGVTLDPVAGREVTPDIEWYAAGYNGVVRRRLEERYGKDIFAECAREAQKD